MACQQSVLKPYELDISRQYIYIYDKIHIKFYRQEIIYIDFVRSKSHGLLMNVITIFSYLFLFFFYFIFDILFYLYIHNRSVIGICDNSDFLTSN